jgi:hypothetical protein
VVSRKRRRGEEMNVSITTALVGDAVRMSCRREKTLSTLLPRFTFFVARGLRQPES